MTKERVQELYFIINREFNKIVVQSSLTGSIQYEFLTKTSVDVDNLTKVDSATFWYNLVYNEIKEIEEQYFKVYSSTNTVGEVVQNRHGLIINFLKYNCGMEEIEISEFNNLLGSSL